MTSDVVTVATHSGCVPIFATEIAIDVVLSVVDVARAVVLFVVAALTVVTAPVRFVGPAVVPVIAPVRFVGPAVVPVIAPVRFVGPAVVPVIAPVRFVGICCCECDSNVPRNTGSVTFREVPCHL